MKNLWISLLLWPFLVTGQTEKSVNSIHPIASTPRVGATFAVVIGISDYQDPAIPDLRFADRDAEAFADWLRSQEGLALPDSNILFLANKKATNAQIIVSLDWLIEHSRPGDRAFIYFSGHGDVERVTKFQRGFLLGYDSPPAVYGAGAFSLNYLQDILSTLSQNNVQVFVITDACRAGKLAGSSVGGAQATATQLSQQFANEIKILSCQPDEFSLEGEQWGGGRGCFSYHLEDALYGFADANADESVDLLELRRYLEDRVTAEAAPQSQTPMVFGPMKTAIATPRSQALAARRTAKANRRAPFLAIENKGMESLLLPKSDSSLRRMYTEFIAAVDSRRLMSPPGNCANDLFKLLETRPEMTALRGSMKRQLAAALIEEGQTVINKLLQSNMEVIDNIWANRIKYDHLPIYFGRAAEILGEKHYVWSDLKAKEFYFRAMTIRKENYPDSSSTWRRGEKMRLLKESLYYDSTSAVTHYQLGSYEKAAEIAPGWAYIQYLLANYSLDYKFALESGKKAVALDSTFLPAYTSIAWVYECVGLLDSAALWRRLYVNKFLQKIRQDSSLVKAFECNEMGNALWKLGDLGLAKSFLLRGEQLSEGKFPSIYGNMTAVYLDMLEFDEAIRAYNKMTSFPGWGFGPDRPGLVYFHFLNDTASAIKSWAKWSPKWAGASQVQAWLMMGNHEMTNRIARLAIGNPDDPQYLLMHFYIAESAHLMGQKDTADYFFRKVVQMADTALWPKYYGYRPPDFVFSAISYHHLGDLHSFRRLINTVNISRPDDAWIHFNFALIYAQTNNEKAAIASLQKAIELGWQPNPMMWLTGTLSDPLLNPIRETKAYKKLVRKHFPKYYDIATRIPG